jgi:hypothetical protein
VGESTIYNLFTGTRHISIYSSNSQRSCLRENPKYEDVLVTANDALTYSWNRRRHTALIAYPIVSENNLTSSFDPSAMSHELMNNLQSCISWYLRSPIICRYRISSIIVCKLYISSWLHPISLDVCLYRTFPQPPLKPLHGLITCSGPATSDTPRLKGHVVIRVTEPRHRR